MLDGALGLLRYQAEGSEDCRLRLIRAEPLGVVCWVRHLLSLQLVKWRCQLRLLAVVLCLRHELGPFSQLAQESILDVTLVNGGLIIGNHRLWLCLLDALLNFLDQDGHNETLHFLSIHICIAGYDCLVWNSREARLLAQLWLHGARLRLLLLSLYLRVRLLIVALGIILEEFAGSLLVESLQ